MDAAPECFVDGFGEISLKHGMIRIELVSLSGAEPRVTQRLIMNLHAFQQMTQAQNGMLQQMEKAGVIRAAQPGREAEAAPEQGNVVPAVRRLMRIEPVPQPAAASAPAGAPAARPAAELGPPKSPNFGDA
jgi:hypothetical protein